MAPLRVPSLLVMVSSDHDYLRGSSPGRLNRTNLPYTMGCTPFVHCLPSVRYWSFLLNPPYTKPWRPEMYKPAVHRRGTPCCTSIRVDSQYRQLPSQRTR